MSKILYRSEKGYAIREGVEYYVIYKPNANYAIKTLIAGEDEEPANTSQRWLDRRQAEIQADKLNGAKLNDLVKKEKPAEPAKPSLSVQINNITNKEDFKKFLTENKLDLKIVSPVNIEIYNDKDIVFYLKAENEEAVICCGGFEHGNHSAFTKQPFFGNLSRQQYEILLEYIALEYDTMIEEQDDDDDNSMNGLFGISYILEPESTGASALWGILFSKSKMFTKVGHFENKNTSNELDVYVNSCEFTGYNI